MKTYNLILTTALVLGGLGAQSCLDYDSETANLKYEQFVVSEDVQILSGTPDSINYHKEITQEGLTAAANNDELTTLLRATITGQYCLLGGKEGQTPGSHAYQYQYICTDGYAQYAVVPHYYFAYSNDHNFNSTYYINLSFNPGPQGGFSGMKNSVTPVLNHPLIDSIPELKAINLLIYDYGASIMADTYGPFPYQEYKNNRTEAPFTYNDVESVYMTIIANIDTIVACLNHYETERPDWYKNTVQRLLNRYEKLTLDAYNGNQGMNTWIRFANSLKLRLAMRASKVVPQLAKQWAEEAVAAGVIESYDHQIGLTPMNEGFNNPISEITKTWNDSRLGASFESLLMSLDHPYTHYLFAKNGEDLKNNATGEVTPAGTRIVGLRAGGHFGEDQQYAGNQYVGVSQVRSIYIDMAPLYLMKWAEVDFLRAEGAVRGWNMGGSAEFFYYRAIEHASLADPALVAESWGDETDDQYLKWHDGFTESDGTVHPRYTDLEEALPYTYVDPFGDTPDMPSVTKIGVKWNEGDTPEVKLEKIITQKYIALYPNSYEAWAELRRTGYPRLFPVLNPWEGDESLEDGDMIRRMTFPGRDDPSTNSDILNTGIPALGGPDVQAFRLWWDILGGNF
ncbi:MAG: SusD/RagB family nutrient-binding outer membrane lipoprotein [Bacteroidaceae bacterium]|nr:SusD/RagB family nutrient-binding outer membrane lipoprotein [Bacteroidaceae bacterium]